jgi:hypothetical protein
VEAASRPFRNRSEPNVLGQPLETLTATSKEGVPPRQQRLGRSVDLLCQVHQLLSALQAKDHIDTEVCEFISVPFVSGGQRHAVLEVLANVQPESDPHARRQRRLTYTPGGAVMRGLRTRA